MKTIGMLGGMSWESSAVYYRLINEEVRRRSGGQHSAPILMLSVDFDIIHRFQRDGDWQSAGDYLAEAATRLEQAGAELLLLCTNTMHIVAPAIENAINIPMLNLLDVTAEAIAKAGLRQVGLLGTRFTMEEPFYRERLANHGLDVIVPGATDRQGVHDVIYDELCQGMIRDESRSQFRANIGRLHGRGAQGIIAGCTEIGLLVGQDDMSLPLFDTTVIHAQAAVAVATKPWSV